jgi:hypothetical protein
MSPSFKENVTTVLFLVLGFLLAATIILFGTGCAHQRPPSTDSYVERASVISDRIEDKAVIVQEWLKSH